MKQNSFSQRIYYVCVSIYKILHPDGFITAQTKILKLETGIPGNIFVTHNRDSLRIFFYYSIPMGRKRGFQMFSVMPAYLSCSFTQEREMQHNKCSDKIVKPVFQLY